MTGYYDYVLGLIPLALGGITALLVASGQPVTQAVLGGGAVSIALMAHALFVRAPVDVPGPGEDAAAAQLPAGDAPFNSAD